MDHEEEEYEASLTTTGWFIVETIERMQRLGFETQDICDALDLPTEGHMKYMLFRGEEERQKLFNDITGMS